MIKPGSFVPDFSLDDQFGKPFHLSSLTGKKNMVIYFYPKDDTPGCTAEACQFRDQYEDFREADAEVIGISADSPETHLAFAQKHRLGFRLLSDTENKVRELYGVKANFFGLIPGRVTFVVNKQGRVIYTFSGQLNARQHVARALEALGRQ